MSGSQTADSAPFYFVEVSSEDAKGPLEAYTGSSPSKAFVYSSWAWLLERMLRRQIVAGLADGNARLADSVLASRQGAYRLRRIVPRAAGGANYHEVREARLRSQLEDGSGVAPAYGPLPAFEYGVVDPVDLNERMVGLMKWSVWMDEYDGSWSGKTMDASVRVSSTAASSQTSLSVTGEDPHVNDQSSTVTSVSSRPYDPQDLPLFRMLADVRCAGRQRVMSYRVWDAGGGRWADRSASYPEVADPRSPDDDPDHGAYVEKDGATTLRLTGLTGLTARYAVPANPGMDLGPYESSSSSAGIFSRGDKTPAEDALGVREEYPEPSEAGLGTLGKSCRVGGSDAVGDYVAPSPDWDGKPTCWGQWGFPHLDSVPSGGPLRGQLAAMCLAQPCIPPGFHVFANRPWGLYGLPGAASQGFPDDDGDVYGGLGYVARQFPVACSCEPAEMSLALDRLKVTLVPVGSLFARVRGTAALRADVAGSYSSETSAVAEGQPDYHSSSKYRPFQSVNVEVELSGTYAGSLAGLFALPLGLPNEVVDASQEVSLPGGWTAVRSESSRVTTSSSHGSSSSDQSSSTFRTDGAVEGSMRAADVTPLATRLLPSDLAPLRRIRRTKNARVRTDVNGYPFWRDRSPDFSYEDDSVVYGTDGVGEPDEPDDRLHALPPSLRRWAKSAELLAVVKVRATGVGGTNHSFDLRSDTTETWGDGDAGTSATSTTTATTTGRRTHRERVSVVSLGRMDLDTGMVPEFDVVDLLRRLLPPDCPDTDPPTGAFSIDNTYDLEDPDDPYYGSEDPHDLPPGLYYDVSPGSRTSHGAQSSAATYGAVSATERETETLTTTEDSPERARVTVRLDDLYLRVEWDFDTETPPAPEGADAAPWKAFRKLRARLAKVRSAVDGAGLPELSGSIGSAESALGALDARLAAGPDAEWEAEVQEARDALADAQAELADAQAELADAQAELADAQAELAAALGALAASRDDPAAADAEAVAAVRCDSAALAARTAENLVAQKELAVADAQSRLDKMEGDEEATLQEAQGKLADAQGKLADAQGRLADAQGRLADAQGRLDDVSSALDALALAVGEDARREALAQADAAVSQAEAAVSQAEAAATALKSAVGALASAVGALASAVGAARDAVWRYVAGAAS